MKTPSVQITKYENTRFFAVWLDEELFAVVCYKKGALAIKQVLQDILNINSKDHHNERIC